MVYVRVCDCHSAPYCVRAYKLTPGQDNTTKAFFKDHWHQPVRRLGKILMPMICASLVSIFAIFLFYSLIPHLIPKLMIVLYQPHLGHPLVILTHSAFAVLTGIIAVWGGGAMHRHYQSQFRPVRLKITRSKKTQERRG